MHIMSIVTDNVNQVKTEVTSLDNFRGDVRSDQRTKTYQHIFCMLLYN